MFRKFCFSLFLFLMSTSCLAANVVAHLNSEDITGIKTFTDHHGTPGLRPYTILRTTKVPGCERGVFFNHDSNRATYSTVLASIMSSREKISIVAENEIKAPWGDETYCAMTSFEIVN